jgi:hypothetical protein
MSEAAETGAVTGGPRLLLRLEGAGLFALATLAYGSAGMDWVFYLVLFLAPDLSFLAYLAGPWTGALVYNALHTTIGPILLGSFGVVENYPLAVAVALIWAAHIGLDRLLGYGFKYSAGFGFTHLGRLGRAL